MCMMIQDCLDFAVLPLQGDVAILIGRHGGVLIAQDAQIISVLKTGYLFYWECFCAVIELYRICVDPCPESVK